MKLFFCFLMISALSGAAGARDYELPSSYDLRDINGRSYVGEVRDQGHCGSCYAFAVMAAAESTWNLSHNLYNGQAIDMSEAFMVWSLSPLYDDMEVCNGGSTMGPMNSLLDYGMPLENDFPYIFTYTDEEDGSVTADFGEDEHWDAERFSMEEWHIIPPNDIETTKRVIHSSGAVFVAVNVRDPFAEYKEGIFQDEMTMDHPIPDNSTLNHAVGLVGWNDEPEDDGMGYWILRNSWSDEWGEEGYMRIRYASAGVNLTSAYFTDPTKYKESISVENRGIKEAVEWSAGGTLNANGFDLWGGSGSGVTNLGKIHAEANSEKELVTAKGVYIWGGPDGYVMNSGEITGFAKSIDNQAIAYAICMQGGEVDNSGLLKAESVSSANQSMAFGIWAANGGNSVKIHNSNQIYAAAEGAETNFAYGVWADSRKGINITNSGSVDASGDDYSIGMLLTGGPVRLENSGTIRSVSDPLNGDGYGVWSTESSEIFNRGIISGTDYSIFAQKDTLLVLETGSSLSGQVKLKGSNDRLLLRGEGSEDEVFSGVEDLSMEGVFWSLSGDSDFENIFISSGRLRIDGITGGDVSVMKGAVLEGTGTLKGRVTSSGITAPGHSVGALTIDGDFYQDDHASLEIEAGRGTSDRLIITGSANIDGTLAVLPSGYADSGSYTFLDAQSGINGAFKSVFGVAVLDVNLSRSGSNQLVMAVNRKKYSALANAHNMGLAQNLDLTRPDATGDTGSLLNRVDFAPDTTELNRLLTQLTPRVHGLAGTMVLYETQDLNNRIRRHMEGSEIPVNAGSEQIIESDLWVEYIGRNIRLESRDSYFGMKKKVHGLMAGVERSSLAGLKAGIATSLTRGDYTSNETADTSKGETFHGYVYAVLGGAWGIEKLSMGASLGAGATEFETDRTIAFAGRNAHSRHKGKIYTSFLNASYDLKRADWMIRPFAGLRWARLREQGYRESGAVGANLVVNARHSDSLESYLGSTIERIFQYKNIMLKPNFRFEWIHEFNSDSENIWARMPGGISFPTRGRNLDKDSMRLGAGLNMRFSESIAVALGYDCTVNGADDHSVSLMIGVGL